MTRPIKLSVLLLCLLCFPLPTASQGPPVLTLQWAPKHLLIVRHISGCLSLEGGGLEEKRLTAIPCDASPVLLAVGGVDHLEAPQLRDLVVLESALGMELGRAAIPERYWLAILPIVDAP